MKDITFFLFSLNFIIGCKKTPVSQTPVPAISSITPNSGSIGTSVTISGNDFSSTVSGNTVKFNGITATINSASATSLTVAAPSGGTTGKITLTVDGVINYITDGTHYSEATCIYANGPDVYIAYLEGDNGNTETKILKNGIFISAITDLTIPNSIFVSSNGDVYLTGGTSDVFNAYYFKNGSTIKIANSTSSSSGSHAIL
ncbi:MAG TPA: IPT/TIG domain-containing protein [Puia sp.]|nr:IPT/TIG domain-containing protein [Puia sp.]